MTTNLAERGLRNAVLKATSALGVRLFRVNTGMAWAGKAQRRGNDVLVRDAYPVHMGLCDGGSDLIGWTTITITADMVGRTMAVFTAIELKVGRMCTTPEQDHFMARVREAGGLADVARSADEACHIISPMLSVSCALWRSRI